MRMVTEARPLPRQQATSLPPVADLLVGAVPLVALSSATCWLLSLPASLIWQTAALYAGLAALVLWKLPESVPGPGIGLANRVTLMRSGGILVLLALAVGPELGSGLGYWWACWLAGVALALDGVDGQVARRTRSGSAFGARFDMEMDSLLLLAMSVLLWRSEKVGAWVLLIGLFRYLFVLAGGIFPVLRGELRSSLRGKVVCAVQGLALLIGLAPTTPSGPASLITGGALVLLTYSFLVDSLALVREERTHRARS